MNRFKRAINALNKQENPSITLNELFQQAINVYLGKKYDPTSYTGKRKSNIEAIKKIVENCDLTKQESTEYKLQSLSKLAEDLSVYFCRKNYERGVTGRSYLEDCVYAALTVYQEKLFADENNRDNSELRENTLKKALLSLESRGFIKQKADNEKTKKINYNTLYDYGKINIEELNNEYTLEVHGTQSIKSVKNEINKVLKKGLRDLDLYARTSTTQFTYHLKDMIEYAIRAYEGIKDNKKTDPLRTTQINELRELLTENIKDTDLVANVQAFFKKNNISTFSGSRLRQLVFNAMNQFSNDTQPHVTEKIIQSSTRTIQTKTWVNEKKAKQEKRKIVLAIHGLQDSVDTFNGLAVQYVDAGYEVISYDQHGHGFDEKRNKTSLNLNQMRADFYKMLDNYAQDPSVEEIILVGHSLGAAIISNSLDVIQVENNKAYSKIKNIELLAPAALKNPRLQIINSLIYLGSGDRTNPEEYARTRGTVRLGGPKPPISLFSDFIAFVADSFTSLRRAVSKKYNFQLKIHAGEEDHLVPISNFVDLKKQSETINKEDTNAYSEDKKNRPEIVFYAKGRHFFHTHTGYSEAPVLKQEGDSHALHRPKKQ